MSNWEIKQLGEVSTVFADGDWIESKDQASDGIRLIQTGNIGIGFFKDKGEKARYVSEHTFNRLKCTEIFEGDCLVSRLPEPVGRVCILPELKERAITAVDCTIIRFRDGVILSKWFVYYSLCDYYQNEINKLVTGATRQRISRKNFALINIPIPPLSEQQRIVAILDEVFAKIDKAKNNAEQNLKNAKELFESYLYLLLQSDGSWNEKRLGEIIKFEYGKPLDKKYRKSDGLYPVYGANGVKSRADKFFYDHKTIIVGRKGSAGEINLTEEKFWPLDVTYYVAFDNTKLELLFIFYMLLGLKLTKLAKGVKPGLNRNDVYDIKVKIPDIKTQRDIVEKIEELSKDAKRLEEIYQQKINSLNQVKRSVLQKAFSGEL